MKILILITTLWLQGCTLIAISSIIEQKSHYKVYVAKANSNGDIVLPFADWREKNCSPDEALAWDCSRANK